ncbi:putative reverse transcriptase domain-containing protein [Tanacetum coccineum]
MDWLSKRKFVIVCHEKVVEIPIKEGGIFRVYGERTLGVAKALMNAKIDELRISDIPVVRDFTYVFPEDLLGLPPQQTSLSSYSLKTFWPTQSRRRNMKLVLESLRKEKLYAKFSKLGDALSRKERVKSRRVRGMILAAQSKAFKQENVLLVGSVMDDAHASRYLVHPGANKAYYNLGDMYWEPRVEKDIATHVSKCQICLRDNSKEWNSSDDQLRLRWMTYLMVLVDAAESVRDAIGFEYCLASLSGWKK